jgi:hypothetical protein
MKIKKTICALLTLVIIIGVLATAALAVAPTPAVTMPGNGQYEPYLCTGDAVNVRSGPSTIYASFGYILRNETFRHRPYNSYSNGFAYGFCDENTNISNAYNCDKVYGWVSGNYLMFDTSRL